MGWHIFQFNSSSTACSILIMACAMPSCSVFDPPSLRADGGAGTGGTGGEGPGTGGGSNSDASVESGGDSSFDASKDAPAGPESGSDSSEDVDSGIPGAWWRVTNQYGCQSAGAPKRSDRPAFSDPGDDLPPIFLAESFLRIGAVNDDTMLTTNLDAWREIGFDLDGVCTNSSTCEVNQVQVNDRACSNASLVPFDGDECRDNEIGKVFKVASMSPSVGVLFGFTEADWNCELYRGGFAEIFKISQYNGKPNDAHIQFDMYASPGLKNLPGWTCRTSIDAPLATDWFNHGKWLPTDPWTISSRTINPLASIPSDPKDLPDATQRDADAFVRNGYLFATIPDGAELWLDGENTPVPGFRPIAHRGFIVGQLVQQQDGTWNIEDGTIAYVSLPGETLLAYREIGFCENMCATFNQTKDYLNTHQDALSGTLEILPDTPCNALSAATAIKARQATVLARDVVVSKPITVCPEPRHPDAPRQGCVCDSGSCDLPDAGSRDAGTDGSTDAGGN